MKPRRKKRKLGVRVLACSSTPKIRVVGAGGAADRRVNKFLSQVLTGQFN